MVLSLLVRRLLAPIVAIVGVVCAIIVVYAGVRLASVTALENEVAGLVWVGVGGGVVGTILIVLATVLYSRAQSRAIVEAFERALPRNDGPTRRLEAPDGASIDDVAGAMAQSFAQLIAQGSKDQ